MPTGMLIAGAQLRAESEDRVFSALLVPYNEDARSNLGRFSVSAGVLELPQDLSTMQWNDGHDREHPIATTTLLAEAADGIRASFRVANGKAGDAMVRDIRSGKRKAVSVEAADMVIEGGRAIAGRIFGAAIVSEGKGGAFPSALLEATAEDDVQDPEDPTQAHYTTTETDPLTGDVYTTEVTIEETEETDPDTGEQTITTVTTSKRTIIENDGDKPPQEGTPVPTAPVPAGTLTASERTPSVPDFLRGGRRGIAAKPKQPATVDKRTLFAMLAAAAPAMRGQDWNPKLLEQLRSPRVVGTLMASQNDGVLTDITFDSAGSPSDMIVPQWIGELWMGRVYSQRWIPLFNHADLTSDSVKGWKWDPANLPTVGPYTGNKTNVPSGPIKTIPYNTAAVAFAGAHDVDRRYRDFGVAEFWDGYFTAMTASYAKQVDLYVAQQLFGAGITTPVAGGVVPTGVNPVMAKIVDGAIAILDHGLPSFAIVSNADFRTLMLTREQDNLAFLNTSLGLEEGTIEQFRVVPAGTQVTNLNTSGNVLVGDKNACSVYELPGSPIRIEGLDVARGGIDPGLFGYAAFVSHQPLAIANVTPHS